jgi:hypothetical protein
MDFAPPPHDLAAMAEVLESKHGIFAAGIADFFALYHEQRGSSSKARAWAWRKVAEVVRTRERERLEDL